MATPRRAFLDANVIRGQLTTDVLLSIAETDTFEPYWSQTVLDEARRNRPPGVSEAAIDRRIRAMNRAFPDAMVTGHEHLIPDMPADDKDKHVLAAAVHSNADVLVTENTKDFHPPSSGQGSVKVVRTSEFLGQVMDDYPQEVRQAMEDMVERNKREPRTMPQLIERMAAQQDLAGFADKLHATLPPEKRSASSIALDGVAQARGAVRAPGVAPGARQGKPGEGPERGPTKEV